MSNVSLRTRAAALVAPVLSLSPRRELVTVLLIIAESMIVYLYAGIVLAEYAPPHDPLPVTLIFTVLLLAYQVPHLLTVTRIWSPEYEAIMITSLVFTFFLVLKVGAFPGEPWLDLDWLTDSADALIVRPNDAARPVWGLVTFTAYAWWRGRWRGEPMVDTTYGMLRWGLILVTGGLILIRFTAPVGAPILETASEAVVGYLVFTLLAIAVARQPSRDGSVARRTLWIWMTVVALPIAAIAVTTLSTAEVLSRDLLALVVAVVAPLLWIVGIGLRAIVLLVAILIFVLIAPLLWLLDRHDFGPFGNLPVLDLSPRTPAELNEMARSTLDIADPLRYLVASAVLLFAGWLIVRFTFRRRQLWDERTRQQRSSLIEWEDPSRTLIRRAHRWLRRRFTGSRDDQYPGGDEWEATRRVRRAYGRFLRLCHDNAIERAPGSTPRQFADIVAERHRSLTSEIDCLTQHYNSARYSGRPMSMPEAEQTEAALATIRERFTLAER